MKKIKYAHVFTAVLFVVAALVIDYFFPHEGRFRYVFFEGKPWRYELLTAPWDFPVYKADDDVKRERDSVAASFEPYFRFDAGVGERALERLRADVGVVGVVGGVDVCFRYLERSLSEVYARGVVSAVACAELSAEGRSRIRALDGNFARSRLSQDLYTVRTAYEAIVSGVPAGVCGDTLRGLGVDRYLSENLVYDADVSGKALDEELRRVAIASGMVQAGEKIVDRGEIVDAHIYAALRSLKLAHESKSGGGRHQGEALLGQCVLVLGLMLCFWLYMRTFRLRLLYSRKNTLFLLSCITFACVLTALCASSHPFNIYILPYAIVPIVVRTFLDSRTALFTHLSMVLICSFLAPYPHEFLLLQTVAGMVVTFSLREMSERSQLMRCALYIYLSYAVSYTGMQLYVEGDFTRLNAWMYLYFGVNFVLLMFAYVLVYILERMFGYVSSISLVELSNINKPLLKRLSEVAPGTFQHSMQVSILASAAVEKIGGNAALVRTGALYHDIGKTLNPAFFTENQNSVNPHDSISSEQSAQIVISHVTDGIRMAEKASLPQAVIDFIRTHHGKGKARFFFIEYKNRHPDVEVDECLFTYPGPNPFSKETAVLMMADAVEAASRSLKVYTEEAIAALVERIISSQLSDGLLNHAPVTFLDIEKVKRVFVEKLKIAYHTRISYPEEAVGRS
ncbi:MAG: HDIG domain-containing protein [Tannerellaceae bacterium]|jgi:putative nucleotidyltransferase with HDIG domain|nr:HDIG domain-containing protein [Tannerellaceae bacterium]